MDYMTNFWPMGYEEKNKECNFWRMSLKGREYALLPFFCLAGWNVDIKDVAPAAILNHEVTWV